MYTIGVTGRINDILPSDTIRLLEGHKELLPVDEMVGKPENVKIKDKFAKYLSETPTDPMAGEGKKKYGRFGESSRAVVPYKPPRRRRM